MANIRGISTNYSTIDGYIDAWESDVNVSNNTSMVHAKVYLHRNNSWSGNTYSSSVWRRLSIDGVDVANYTAAMTVPPQSSGYVCVAEGSRTITHNSDGSKSVTIGYQATDNVSGSYLGSSWQTGTLGLTTIPRQATITGADNFNDDGNPKITYSNPAGNSVSALDACISLTGAKDDVPYRAITKTGSSYTFNLTTAERNTLLTAASASTTLSVIFYVRTKIGSSTYYSTLTRTMTVVNGQPTFTNFTYQDTNSASVAVTNNNQQLIQGISTLQVDISSANQMVPKKCSTFKQYTAQISGLSKSLTSITGSITGFGTSFTPGEQTLSVTATDSRSLTTSVQKTVKVLAYSEPVIDASATRKNNFENETTLHISGKISTLNNGTSNLNQVSSIKYRYKSQSTSTWGSWQTKSGWTLNNDGSYTIADNIISLDNTQAYDFEIQVTDRLKTTTVSLAVSMGIPIMRIGTDGFVYNNEQPLMPSHVGQIILSTTLNTAAKVQQIYGGTWVQVSAGRALWGADSSHAGGTTISAGLPNIKGTWHNYGEGSGVATMKNSITGCVYGVNTTSPGWGTSTGIDQDNYMLGIDASRSSSIYGNSTTVQPPAYVVYVWKRTA